MTPEEYSRFRSIVAIRVNKQRATPEHIQVQIKNLYLTKGFTAKQVAEELNITHGAVRSTISRLYANITLDERKLICKNHGSWLNKKLKKKKSGVKK